MIQLIVVRRWVYIFIMGAYGEYEISQRIVQSGDVRIACLLEAGFRHFSQLVESLGDASSLSITPSAQPTVLA